MSRLPSALEPLFPAVKRTHRLATRVTGAVSRPISARRSARNRLPWRGTDTSEQTQRLEPQTVRLHVVAAGRHVHRPCPEGDSFGRPFFEALADYDVPRRHALELIDGLVVGDYAAHVTAGGTLDYETSEYFGTSGWREHPVFLRPRLPEVTDVPGTLLSLATRGTGANYYHFVMDLLPRWGIFREVWPDVEPDRLLLNRKTPYQRELLALLGLDQRPALEPRPDRAYRADRLLVPGQPNLGTLAPPWTTSWLRSVLPPRRPEDRPRRIYVSRGARRNTRRVVNEAELLPELERRGFRVIDPGGLSVQDQIDHFAAAEVVVAPHGAALTNLTFAAPGVRVLELFAPRYLNSCYWTITTNIPESRYCYLVGDSGRRHDPRGPMLGVQDDIRVDPARFAAALDQILD